MSANDQIKALATLAIHPETLGSALLDGDRTEALFCCQMLINDAAGSGQLAAVRAARAIHGRLNTHQLNGIGDEFAGLLRLLDDRFAGEV